MIFNQSIPQRKGKQYQTPEECLKENGEHVWSEPFNPNEGIGCLVYHHDGYCDMREPKKICYHCPAEQRLVRIQQEIKEWK